MSNTAGAALWVIDYTLQAATQDISKVLFHEGVGFKYNFVSYLDCVISIFYLSSSIFYSNQVCHQLIFGSMLQIQPITLNRSTIDGSPLDPPEQPHIQPSYYAGLLINTFIGSSGNAQISELTVWDDNVSGYAAYENGKLVRAVFINLDAWLQSSVGSRPSVHIDPILYWSEDSSVASDAAAWKNKKAQGRRIIINHADDIQNLTWAGQSWETSDIRPKGRLVVEKVDLASGFDLRSTEAILLSFTS